MLTRTEKKFRGEQLAALFANGDISLEQMERLDKTWSNSGTSDEFAELTLSLSGFDESKVNRDGGKFAPKGGGKKAAGKKTGKNQHSLPKKRKPKLGDIPPKQYRAAKPGMVPPKKQGPASKGQVGKVSGGKVYDWPTKDEASDNTPSKKPAKKKKSRSENRRAKKSEVGKVSGGKTYDWPGK